MQNRRRHFFVEATVITGLLPTGEYGAILEDDSSLWLSIIRGHGHSRYSAIADLVEMIAKTEEQSDEMEAANV